MEKRYAIIVLIIIFLACTAGCTSAPPAQPVPTVTTTPVVVPAQESRTVTVPPSEMALQLTDMNPDYRIKDRSVMISPEVTRLAQGLGWRQGYFVLFYRLDKDRDDQTFVRQSINIFPIENMNKVFTIEKEDMKSRSGSSGTFREMPFPKIGDNSIAFRGSNENDPYGVGIYSVIFTKKDVYEEISMDGTTTDYETFKDIAQKAAEKIR